jgi:hypothetical protein
VHHIRTQIGSTLDAAYPFTVILSAHILFKYIDAMYGSLISVSG